MRACRFCIAILLVPSEPGTVIIWLRESDTSLNIFPPLRMIALSAMLSCDSLTVSHAIQNKLSNSVIQSPRFMDASDNMIIEYRTCQC